jgi:hypothetical protein
VAALVVSHWLLDVASHTPDMPVTLHGPARLGLGLWRSVPWTLGLELLLLATGSWLYLRSTRARDRIGSMGFAVLVGLLAAIYLAALFGPPPPSPQAVAWSAQAMWLFVLFGWWVDRHRTAAKAA